MVPSTARIVGRLLPGRLYHRLVVRLARLPLVPTQSFRHSVVFRHPLHPRSDHYLLIPTEYSPTILDLPAPAAQRAQQDIREWITATSWRVALIVVNFGAYQETPFLHIHLLQSSTPPANGAAPMPEWLTVELKDAPQPFWAGRRKVRYDALKNKADVTTNIYLN